MTLLANRVNSPVFVLDTLPSTPIISPISNLPNISQNEVVVLAKAHHNLAICYLKKDWLDSAEQEASKAFNLLPTEDNHATLSIVKSERKKKK